MRASNRKGRGALFLLPAIAFAISPVAAAGSRQHWISLCTGEGARLVLLGGGGDVPSDKPDDRGHGMCAHATSPREIRPGGKARTRP